MRPTCRRLGDANHDFPRHSYLGSVVRLHPWQKKYPKWHEAKKYFEGAGWSCNRIGFSYYLHRKGEFLTSKTFELTLDQLKKACVIAQEHNIREVEVELHDCALFAQPVQE